MVTVLVLFSWSAEPQALSSVLQALWTFDMFPHFFAPSDPPGQPGPFDLQNEHCAGRTCKLHTERLCPAEIQTRTFLLLTSAALCCIVLFSPPQCSTSTTPLSYVSNFCGFALEKVVSSEELWKSKWKPLRENKLYIFPCVCGLLVESRLVSDCHFVSQSGMSWWSLVGGPPLYKLFYTQNISHI